MIQRLQHDADFGRKLLNNKLLQPPFYAVLTYAINLITFGGMLLTPTLSFGHILSHS